MYPFVARYMKKWGWRPSWVTLDESIASGRMGGGEHVFDYVLDNLRAKGGLAIPALRLGTDTETKVAVARAISWDQHGTGVIVRLEDLMRNDVGVRILALVNDVGGRPDEVDVLIDMAAPNYEPYEMFANALVLALRNLGDTSAFRNLIVVGTAIPESLASVAKGSDDIPRHDWLFYQVLLKRLPADMRRPTYGDPHDRSPSIQGDRFSGDPTLGKSRVHDAKDLGNTKGGRISGMIPRKCTPTVRRSSRNLGSVFAAVGFSHGDDFITKCAVGAAGPSNLTRWKEVGISHPHHGSGG